MQTRRQMEPSPPPVDVQRESFGEILGELANQSAGLVRDEVALAKQELHEKFISLRTALIIVAAGGLVAIIALLALCAAGILALAAGVGAWQAALIVGAGLALISGVVIAVGVGKLKQTSLKPEQTLQTLEEDKEWLKELT